MSVLQPLVTGHLGNATCAHGGVTLEGLISRRLKDLLVIVALATVAMTFVGSSCSVISTDHAVELVGLADFGAAPLWTPDGSKIVFSRPAKGTFVVHADGSRLWPLPPNQPVKTSLTPGNFSPALSPDGSRIAYAEIVRRDFSDYTSAIVTSALDGSDRVKLTSNGAVDAHPTWSPDGKQIAFVSTRETTLPALHLYVMDADGSNVRNLVPSVAIWGNPPAWSPDGTRIAFIGYHSGYDSQGKLWSHYQVHTVRPDGSGLAYLGETASHMAWSPDGSQIAFIEQERESRTLRISDPEGIEMRSLSSPVWARGSWYGNVLWSPDGSEIAYGEERLGARSPVVIAKVDDSEFSELPEPNLGDDRHSLGGVSIMSWSPDGSRLAVQRFFEDSTIVLYSMLRDGTDVQVLARDNEGHIEADQ